MERRRGNVHRVCLGESIGQGRNQRQQVDVMEGGVVAAILERLATPIRSVNNALYDSTKQPQSRSGHLEKANVEQQATIEAKLVCLIHDVDLKVHRLWAPRVP